MGQHLKGHVFEGAGGAVPQLEAVGAVAHAAHRGHRRIGELPAAVSRVRVGRQLRRGELIQKRLHHVHRPLLIGHILQRGQAGQPGKDLRRHQPAVGGKALFNGLRRRHAEGLISCADIIHSSSTTFMKLLKNRSSKRDSL